MVTIAIIAAAIYVAANLFFGSIHRTWHNRGLMSSERRFSFTLIQERLKNSESPEDRKAVLRIKVGYAAWLIAFYVFLVWFLFIILR